MLEPSYICIKAPRNISPAPVKSFADSLKSEYPVFESLEIQDADHNYLNEPDILIELVNQWLKSS